MSKKKKNKNLNAIPRRVPLDLLGKKFGMLHVLEKAEERRKWNCMCDCGILVIVRHGDLVRGTAKSCGCKNNYNDRLYNHPMYDIWNQMVKRCTNPNNKWYKYFGGRGIKVSMIWLDSPKNFIKWCEKQENYNKPNYNLFRFNNKLGYNPSNLGFVEIY